MKKRIRNWYRRFLVWIGLIKLRPEAEIKRLLEQSIQIEEQAECSHKMLSAWFPNDIWYRCTECKQVWIITEAMQIKPAAIPELIKKLQSTIKMQAKRKKISTPNKQPIDIKD